MNHVVIQEQADAATRPAFPGVRGPEGRFFPGPCVALLGWISRDTPWKPAIFGGETQRPPVTWYTKRAIYPRSFRGQSSYPQGAIDGCWLRLQDHVCFDTPKKRSRVRLRTLEFCIPSSSPTLRVGGNQGASHPTL